MALQKLYCYVDETGQDTEGRLFIVVAVVVGHDREEVRGLLMQIELASGKGKKKWTKATRKQHHAYIERVVQQSELRGTLFYTHFSQTTEYLACLIQTIAAALATAAAGQPYEASVLIDGLGKAEQHHVGTALRRHRVPVKKTRGLRDESDEFIRLADAMAGFVRQQRVGRPDVAQLYHEAVTRGLIMEV